MTECWFGCVMLHRQSRCPPNQDNLLKDAKMLGGEMILYAHWLSTMLLQKNCTLLSDLMASSSSAAAADFKASSGFSELKARCHLLKASQTHTQSHQGADAAVFFLFNRFLCGPAIYREQQDIA